MEQMSDNKYMIKYCKLCNKKIKAMRNKKLCIKCKPPKQNGRDMVRFIVRRRDNFTCQDCGKVRTPKMSKKLGKRQFDVHHLNGLCGKKSRGYDKISEIDTLITLCHKCHYNRAEHRCKSKSFGKNLTHI